MSPSLPDALQSGIFRLDFIVPAKNAALEAKLSEYPRWSASRRASFENQLKNSWSFLNFASRVSGQKLMLILKLDQRQGLWNPAQKRLSIWFDIFETASKQGSSNNAALPRFIGVVLREMGVQSSLQDLLNAGVGVSFTRTSSTSTPLMQSPTPIKPNPAPTIPAPINPVKPTPVTNAPLPTMTQLQTPGFVQKTIGHNEALRKGEQYVLTMAANASLQSKQLKDFQNALDQKFGQGVTQAKRFTASNNIAEVLFLVVRQPEISPVIGGKEIAPALVLTALAIAAALGLIWAITLTVERIAILVNDTTTKGQQTANTLGAQVEKVGLGISAALLGAAALWYVFIRK